MKPLWSSPHCPGIAFGTQSLSEKSRLMVGLESNETLTSVPLSGYFSSVPSRNKYYSYFFINSWGDNSVSGN